MAEVVHRNLEAMLPQLEEFESSGIFTHGEIRAIVKFRRKHEYRMVRRPAHKEDFLEAIKYEMHLDLLRKQRKKRLKVTRSRRDADYGIQDRIHGLFRRVLKKFKGDLKLWLQYIEFAEKSHHKISLSRIFGKALAIHPSAISVWIMAAKFQFEELKDPSSARSLLHQGLRANKSSPHLWLEYFRMELMHADKVRKGKDGDVEDTESDEFLSYKVASVVFHQAIKTIPNDVKFRLSFLPICRLFPDTSTLQDEVYDSLRKDFPHHPLMWDALARRPWVGVDTAALKASQVLGLESRSDLVFEEGLLCVAAQMEQGSEVMAEGEGVADTTEVLGYDESLAALWECYFNWSLERWQEESSFKAVKKKTRERLLTTFCEPCSNGQLNEKTCEQYVRMLQSCGERSEALSAVTFALKTHPSSVALWLLRLGMVGVAPSGSTHGEVGMEELGDLCKQALDQVPVKESLPIWQCWLDKATTEASEHEVEEIFQSGVECGCDGVSETLGGLYLEWSFGVGGLSKARTVYNRHLESFPVPYSLYLKCVQVEEMGMASRGMGVASGEMGVASGGVLGLGDMDRLRAVYERALRDYGATSVDLWLRYTAAELRHQEEGSVERVNKLHWRASKQLQPSLTADFTEQYSIMQLTDT